MARFAGYVRVSRVGDRADTLISPDLQAQAIEAWAARHGHEVEMLEPELDRSGGDDTRPILIGAIERVEAGSLDGIVVWRLDRFARSLRSGLQFIERIEAAGGSAESASENFDTQTPSGRMMRNFTLSIAQAEREEKALAFEASKADAVQRGIHISGRVPLGYVRGPDRRLVPDPAIAPLVVEAFEGRARGESWSKIADGLAVGLDRDFYGPTVSRMIANRAYLGEARQGAHVNPTAHEPIVPQALWNAANAARSQAPPRGEHPPALLGGIVRCASCSWRMTSTFTKGRREYRCRKKGARGTCPSPAHIAGPIVEPLVERAVLHYIEDRSVEASARGTALADAEERLAEARAELDAFQTAARALDGDFAAGLGQRSSAVVEAERAVDAARVQVGVPSAESIRDVWPTLEPPEKSRLMREALDVVWVRSAVQGGSPVERVRLVVRGYAPDGLSVQGRPAAPIAAPWPPIGDLPGEVPIAVVEDRDEGVGRRAG